MNYKNAVTIQESGAKAFRDGLGKSDCPVDYRTEANEREWWRQGWESAKAFAAEQKCRGELCEAVSGVGHSKECIAEHESHYSTMGGSK